MLLRGGFFIFGLVCVGEVRDDGAVLLLGAAAFAMDSTEASLVDASSLL